MDHFVFKGNSSAINCETHQKGHLEIGQINLGERVYGCRDFYSNLMERTVTLNRTSGFGIISFFLYSFILPCFILSLLSFIFTSWGGEKASDIIEEKIEQASEIVSACKDDIRQTCGKILKEKEDIKQTQTGRNRYKEGNKLCYKK